MKPDIYDFIIIGQGLAGSILAWRLHHSNKKLLILDCNPANNASKVGAGLINPITGPRLAKHKNAEILLQHADQLYNELQIFFNTDFYYQHDYKRIFQTTKELEYWQLRKKTASYQCYFSAKNKFKLTNCNQDFFTEKFGSILQTNTRLLDMPKLLALLRDYFQAKGMYLNKQIKHSEISIHSNYSSITTLKAKQIIFCEGHLAINNPWFSWLPFINAKGEILTLEANSEIPQQIINFGNWYIPITNRQFKFGATYEWDFSTKSTSEKGKQQLLDALQRKLIHQSHNLVFNIQKHQAGIRPCSKDRRAFIGRHPLIQQLLFFNGFGSKGALQIPYYAEQLIAHIKYKTALEKDINIARYWRNK